MAFNNLNGFDQHVVESLLRRLQLSPSLDEILSTAASTGEDSEEEETDLSSLSPQDRRRRHVSREESELESELVRMIHSGLATEKLKPNSGQSVSVGEHSICVAVHVDSGKEYRIWEWHGHVMLYDDEAGYDAEYIYGNYFEKITSEQKVKLNEEEEEEEEDYHDDDGEEDEKELGETALVNSGLRDLIDGGNDEKEKNTGRVLHRSSLNSGKKAAS